MPAAAQRLCSWPQLPMDMLLVPRKLSIFWEHLLGKAATLPRAAQREAQHQANTGFASRWGTEQAGLKPSPLSHLKLGLQREGFLKCLNQPCSHWKRFKGFCMWIQWEWHSEQGDDLLLHKGSARRVLQWASQKAAPGKGWVRWASHAWAATGKEGEHVGKPNCKEIRPVAGTGDGS